MSGPEDQHPWDREDEEIRQAFAEKDAEIARLKKLNVDLFNDLKESQFKVGDRDAEIARLKQFNLMTDEQVVMDLKAEVKRLKALLSRAATALDNGDLAILEEMREASK
jgi:hypothetical protein